MAGLSIRDDLDPGELRALARRERNGRTASRMLAIANALEGMMRADAARLAGMERQALRDAVVRYNAEGIAGLRDRPRSGRPMRLTPGQVEKLVARVLAGPKPERDGISSYTLPDLCAWVERRFKIRYEESGMSRLVRRLGLSWQKARPQHPRGDAQAREEFKKSLAAALSGVAAAQGDRRIELWFADEARVGQKGRVGHRWWPRGLRAPGLCDKRFESAYLFGAVRPASGDGFALVLPEVSTEAMNVFLAQFAQRLAPDAHGVLVLDQAGWHGAKALVVPSNVTLVKLPPYSPELNPVERIWLYLRERYLSHRVLKDYDAVVRACCKAWNDFAADKARVRSLTEYEWIREGCI